MNAYLIPLVMKIIHPITNRFSNICRRRYNSESTRRLSRILTLTIVLTCLETQGESGRCYQIYDPFENFNRGVFNFNRGVDHTFFKPLVKTYYYFIPKWGHNRVMSFFRNLAEPLSFLNYLAQGNARDASKTLWRFLMNTTLGLGGLFDPASKAGLTAKQQIFSDTMAHYKINYGAYLIVPILGASSTRNFYGTMFDTLTDPIRLTIMRRHNLAYEVATSAYKRIKHDHVLDTIEESSLDQYIKMRDLYIQSLAALDPACEGDETQIDYENFAQ